MQGVLSGLKYNLHIIFHPFDGYWDMRHEKRGNLYSCLILYVVFIFAMIIAQQYTGFLMNPDFNPKTYNVIKSVVSIAVPLLLWSISNWSITALMEGEGRFVDIVMATAYALLPLTITTLIVAIASNFVVADELDLVNLINYIGLVWSGFLMFASVATVHQYSVTKTIFTILITIFGMAFIIFLALLFGSIFDKMFSYVMGIIIEIRLRM